MPKWRTAAFGQKRSSARWHVHSERPLSGKKPTLPLGTLTIIITETIGQKRSFIAAAGETGKYLSLGIETRRRAHHSAFVLHRGANRNEDLHSTSSARCPDMASENAIGLLTTHALVMIKGTDAR